jgi:hypothetical protein
MYHIYMPVEMVLLMTKNRHYYRNKSVDKSTHEVSQSKANEYESQFALPSNIIELCKYS